MISAWHLLWIVPLSASFGCIIAALMVAASTCEEVHPDLTRENQPRTSEQVPREEVLT